MAIEQVRIKDHLGREEELRPIWVPHKQGYAFAARDGRVFGRGRTLDDAYASLQQAGLLCETPTASDPVA